MPRTTPRSLLPALAVAAGAWTTAALALVLFALNGGHSGALAYWLMDVLVAVVYGGACLLLLPRSRHPVTWILVLAALGCGVSALLSAFLETAAAHDLTVPPLLPVVAGVVWVPGTYASIAVLPWLVGPEPLPRRLRPVVALGIAALVWRVLASLSARYVGLDNPLDVVPEGVHALRRTVGLWPDRLCVVLGLAGAARLVWRWRTVPAEEARGLGWLSIGALFLAVSFVPVVVPMPAAVDRVALDLSGILLIAAQPFLVGALLTVVLGQQLWGVDVAVDRATLWLLLTLALTAGYVVVGWGMQRMLALSADTAAWLAFAAMLVVSHPLRTWLQARVDALVYGPAHDPTRLLGSVGSVTGAPVSARGSLEALVDGLAAGLRLGRVEVHDDRAGVVVAVGAASAAQRRYPLRVHGRRRGELVVAAPPGQLLDARTAHLVEQFAGVVAVFLELTEVNEQLDRARDRLVQVRHEERRILRRDLHDGLGPALAGIGLGIAAARRRTATDPVGAVALLDDLAEEVGRRTQDVRLLARSMLPVALDDGDLPGALAALAARFEAAGTRVEVDVESRPDMDTARQIATYHVASEALVNAWRHGGARHVRIRVSAGPAGEVVLEVSDDGSGIGSGRGTCTTSAAPRGVGLASMRERVDELAGQLSLEGGERGTTVRMVLP